MQKKQTELQAVRNGKLLTVAWYVPPEVHQNVKHTPAEQLKKIDIRYITRLLNEKKTFYQKNLKIDSLLDL